MKNPIKFTCKEEVRAHFESLNFSKEQIDNILGEKYSELPATPPIEVIEAGEFKEKITELETEIALLKDKSDKQLAIQEELNAIIKDYTEKNRKGKFSGGNESIDNETFGYKYLSEFVQDVHYAGKSNRMPERLQKAGELYDKQKATGMSTFIDADGGFLVPPQYSNNLFIVAYEKSSILSRITGVPMTSNSIKFPYVDGFDHSSGQLYGGIIFKWVQEGTVGTATKPKLGELTLDLKDLMGLLYTTNQLLEDSPISLEPLFNTMFTDALVFILEKSFIGGNGVGKPLGFMNAPCTITVDKEDTQTKETIWFENVVNMFSRIWRTQNAMFLANRDTLPQLMKLQIVIGGGGVPLWIPANSISGRPHDTLMGLPIEFSEHCKTCGTAGDLMLNDWTQYIVGRKVGAEGNPKTDTSIHLKFDYNETCFRFTFRVDGQPWWKSALTPAESTKTLSPSVIIQTRA